MKSFSASEMDVESNAGWWNGQLLQESTEGVVIGAMYKAKWVIGAFAQSEVARNFGKEKRKSITSKGARITSLTKVSRGMCGVCSLDPLVGSLRFGPSRSLSFLGRDPSQFFVIDKLAEYCFIHRPALVWYHADAEHPGSRSLDRKGGLPAVHACGL